MTTTSTYSAPIPATVGNGKAVHAAKLYAGNLGVDCGAVRYRNTTTRSITRQKAGTEITCTKCQAKVAAEVAELGAAIEAQQARIDARRAATVAYATEAPAPVEVAATEDRAYASKLMKGQRVALRGLGDDQLVDRVETWEPRKVLVTLTNGQQRVMGSWAWVRLV